MDFRTNKTPGEVIREGAFGGTYFRDIYLMLMTSGSKIHWKNLISWKILIKSIIVRTIIMLVLINMVLNVEHRWDFGRIMAGLMK